MIRLVQHIPPIVETRDDPIVATVEDVAAMLALPWITVFEGDDFLRWCYDDRYLIAINKDRSRWVVATILEGNVPAAELPDCGRRET